MFIKIFKDRADAGRFLASKLNEFANLADVIVVGLPRGGMPVAYEVAQKLNAPLDLLVVRKLGVPGHEELAMGAIASGGVRLLNQNVLSHLGIPQDIIDLVIESEQRELERREREYRKNHAPLKLRGQTVIVVDDGLATGSSMHAAVMAIRQKQPKQIIVAVPVGARDTCESFHNEVDTMAICAITPESFQSVGAWYANFAPTTDDEVRKCLDRSGLTKRAA
ncbi:MAG TPA: phosphoribosyltransferase [Pyrinomonadaceae bacterium]|jgi:putative phosphoribosyl transferase|nr:phosphoribosyltransferase [Pyrinomonadaceae bacterium]